MAKNEKDVKNTSANKGKKKKVDVPYETLDGYDTKKGKKEADISSPKYFMISAVLIAVALFILVCYGFPEYCGFIGEWTRNIMFGMFAGGAILVPILMLAQAIYLKRDAAKGKIFYRPLFSLVAVLTVSALLHAIFAGFTEEIKINITQMTFDKIAAFYEHGTRLIGGGVFGGALGTLIMSAVGITGTIILAILLILFSCIFLFGFTPRTFVKSVRYKYFKFCENRAIKKQQKEEAAAAALEERKKAEAAARVREERRRAEAAARERELRAKEEEENREIERMRKDTQAHRQRAEELRRANTAAQAASKRTHGDIDEIFAEDFAEAKPKKARTEAPKAPAAKKEEDEEDIEFYGESVAEFWRKNDPDTETTFEAPPEEGENEEPEVHVFEEDDIITEPSCETEDTYEQEYEEEEDLFEPPTYEEKEEIPEPIPVPEEEPEEELPEDAIPWEDVIGEERKPEPEPEPAKKAEPLEDRLRKTLDGARRNMAAPSAVKTQPVQAKTPVSPVAPATPAAAEPAPEPEVPSYIFPPIDLLKQDPGKVGDDSDELHMNAEKLVATLRSFNVRAKIVDVSRGPTITRYEIGLEAGTRVRTIMNLVDDISYALATNGVRIEGVIPGKSAIGIEVPNASSETVYLRSLLEDTKFTDAKSKLTTALGKSVSGDNLYLDISKMPHLLIAGTTGSGKSVCINTILVSLLYKATPDEVKLVLVDPKKVELNVYNGIPHLLVPVVFDPKKAAGALHWCVTEMERRFDLIESMNVRNLDGYNKAIEGDPTKEKLPRIVIVIDELADLMMTASNEVETSICRIAQKARAAGMHLIIGTQRPSVDVITGLIKANVPSRIAFTVMSQVDSRTIIDTTGAEKLIGRGDMLFAPVGCTKPMRAQGAFVSDAELESIIDFIKENAKKAEYSDEIMDRIEKEAALCGKKGKAREEAEADDGEEEVDPKLDSAIKLAVEEGKISTSLIQRRLSLGYGRAAKLIDVMERRGIVGAPDGQRPREVLITKEQYLEMQMRSDGAVGATAMNEAEDEVALSREDFPEDEI
ncbi:MAG: DNA translocase FtsK [Clostridia bacterium]|nr:DNA translocase FtsK [Clostridia bacterium]